VTVRKKEVPRSIRASRSARREVPRTELFVVVVLVPREASRHVLQASSRMNARCDGRFDATGGSPPRGP
jgi:hypothetical protein